MVSGTITNSTGNETGVTVNQLDALLKGKWEEMKEYLSNKNVTGAVTYIVSNTQEMYRYNFELMSDILPSIVQSMTTINLDELEDRVAKYHMNAIQDGIEYSFYVEFVKDGDGLWKIRFF